MSRLNLTFRVYGIPQPAGSKQGFFNKKISRVMIVDANKNAKPWKALVASAAIDAVYPGLIFSGPIGLELVFFVPRPKGHFGKKGLRVAAPEYPTRRPDLLKLARGVEDALTAIVWHDDAQIVSEHLSKRYGEKPGVQVTVVEAS